MKTNPYILKMIREKVKSPLTHTFQFEALAEDIKRVTGEHLGVNTLKRFFDVLPGVEPSIMTVEVIAEYLGYGSWRELNRVIEGKNSWFDGNDGTTYPNDLKEGQIITVKYAPNRVVQLQRTANGWFKVLKAIEGKLLENDLIRIEIITIGVPFMAKDVIRDGVSLGSYTGGIEGGVMAVDIQE